MNVTRKTWISAGIVGAVLIGGMSVAAAAADGGIEKIEGETRKIEKIDEPAPIPPRQPGTPSAQEPSPSQETAPPKDDNVVSREINPDPGQTGHYWTDARLEGAQPMPMPEGPVNATE
ncbi:hypothetical protein SAMN05216276_102585 [Streptosporangium subroseum]|uniref:Uncharacterized protein n=1 Tax=Streptosporangium subroseum TaxID=106412 RepID=A0A239K6H3_9ACTN|nr:hypothetical protein [Streptosporangium subroseum]SNT12774.1 hypothetical protein SAMN05216276_102585 [Streptosporangium subroseum]